MKPSRNYYDDLGGAYYFLPRDVVNGKPSGCECCFLIIVRLILIAFILAVLLMIR